MANGYREYAPEVLKRTQETEMELLKEFIRICEKYGLRYFVMFGTIIGAARHHGFIPWDDDTDVAMPRADYQRFLEVCEKEWQDDDRYRITCPEKPGSYYHIIPRMVKKGTKFYMPANDGRYPNAGIPLDIFPIDYVSSDVEQRKEQIKNAQFWKNVYMVRNVNFMKIEAKTLVKKILHFCLTVIHGGMILFHITPEFIYKKYCKRVFRYPEDKTYMTILCDIVPDKICSKESEFFPVKKGVFGDLEVCLPGNYDALATRIYGNYMTPPPEEKRTNHAPALVEFEDGLRQINGVVENR